MLLTETTAVISAEAEEEAYRLKNVRLAEKGFLPFEEAVGIYQPLTPGEKGLLAIKKAEQYADEKGTVAGVPFYHLTMMDEQNVFARALMSLDQGAMLSNLQLEFATLCNTLVAADNKKIRGKEALGGIVRKACGYISLGFSRYYYRGFLGFSFAQYILLFHSNPVVQSIVKPIFHIIRYKNTVARY